jgi:hypothetical protein
MISYEVRVDVADTLRSRYEIFMRDRHIPDVLATGLALGARFERAEEGRYRVRFMFEDQAALDRYLTVHAPRLRADFLAHFPDGATTSREVWTTLRQWPH